MTSSIPNLMSIFHCVCSSREAPCNI